MGYRNITVKGQNWTYKVGKSFLDIRDPNGKGHRPSLAEVCGLSQADVEKHPENCHATPALVENAILRIMAI